MKQISQQLKIRIQNVNVANNIPLRGVILNILFASLGSLAIWYLIILGSMVFDIVHRKSLEKEALALSSEVGELEVSYLSSLKSIDLPLSSALGYKEAKATFVTRKSLGSLKIAQNEI